ncbi:hypothetical protein ACQ3I4_09430 [Zafaria sp. Z1313]|uniref:MerC domain-containing protein n=1 Tax=Glutamicibacter mishrai TaxID=1775880 RepID=A0A6H0SM65_9MICC|nr:hypothetical protein [Glutamicibacter mishrai]QIV87435.1 hypothetical protein D3791_10065 [Glutamicibacter mishrai]
MSTTSEDQGSRTGLVIGGFVLLHVLCCGLPLLIAAGALGAVGSFLGNPWVILAAVALAVTVLLWTLRRRQPGTTDKMEDCCSPAAGSGQDSAPGRVTQRTGQ